MPAGVRRADYRHGDIALKRACESGMRVLTRLNRTKVRSVLLNLKSSVESEEESNRFSSLAARLNRL